MSNPENVVPYGAFIHEVALHGGPREYLRDFGDALINEASPIIYKDGEKRGAIKGVAVTIISAALMVLVKAGVEKIPALFKKSKEEQVTSEVSPEKDSQAEEKEYIERLLHLQEYTAMVVEKYQEVLAYNVNGRVVNLKMRDPNNNETYDADIVFKNNGHFRCSYGCSDESAADRVFDYVSAVARDIQRLLKGKYVYFPKQEWIEVDRRENIISEEPAI
jgi:hypothetical protein